MLPHSHATGGPTVERMVFLALTEETGGNANGLGIADVVTEDLAAKIYRPTTHLNTLTLTTSQPVKRPMAMPADRLAIATALEMCAGVSPKDARLIRIKNTLKLRRMHVSEALLPEVKQNQRLRVVEEAKPVQFGTDGSLI